jgi:hypothetical protein
VCWFLVLLLVPVLVCLKIQAKEPLVLVFWKENNQNERTTERPISETQRPRIFLKEPAKNHSFIGVVLSKLFLQVMVINQNQFSDFLRATA